jgi:hypothetical protein
MSSEPPQSAAASIFASYSRKDALLVKQLLGLYRAIDVPTFLDEQSIKPGGGHGVGGSLCVTVWPNSNLEVPVVLHKGA